MQQKRFSFWIDFNKNKQDGTSELVSKAAHIMAENLEEARKKARGEISSSYPDSIIISIKKI